MQNLRTKIFTDISTLTEVVKDLKLHKKNVVFTNGCFDIIHAGHVIYLEEAKNEGDFLIVGVNTDNSVQKLKGPNRPLVDETSRLMVLAALASVDAVILFNEDTPIELIQTLNPDVLVKGGDYPVSEIVGAAFVFSQGGTVKTLSLLPGHSTTKIEEKIKTQS